MKKVDTNAKAHVELAALAIAGIALALPAGLVFCGLMERLDTALVSFFQPHGMKPAEMKIRVEVLWLSAAFFAILLPAVILNVQGTWRRLVIWCATFGVILCWGPVLMLASWKPEIGVPVVAVLWAGFCALVYANNHRLPVDEPKKQDAPR